MRGGEKCLEVLCRAFPDAPLYTLIHDRGKLSPTIEAMDIRPSPLQHIPGVVRHYRKLLPLMPLATRAWRAGEVDLVVSLSHCVAKMVRPPAGVPHVCYCFTPMRYAWDGPRRLPRLLGRPADPPGPGRPALLDRLRRARPGDLRPGLPFRGDLRDDPVADRPLLRPREPGDPPPVDADFYTPGPRTPSRPREDFYLCVSALVPYKNLDQAVTACSASGRRLVVIGSGPERARLERLAGPSVEFLGWRSDEVIRDHYRRCRALLFPGEEDFGIVPIEALACQAPVIALGRGGAAETVDDRVGRTYPDPTLASLTDALDSWERDGQPHDPALARARAEALALPIFRRKLLAYLAEVVAGSTRSGGIPSPHLSVGAEARR